MIQLKVNGTEQLFNGAPEMPLLWYLRDILGLTGWQANEVAGKNWFDLMVPSEEREKWRAAFESAVASHESVG